MYRIRVLSDYTINWKNSFNVIMLWEFASAVTPSIVGGSTVAFYILYKEGITAGKSTAMVLITALLDELFLIIFAPLLIFYVGSSSVFNLETELVIWGLKLSITTIFFTGYGFLVFLSMLLAIALFVRPQLIYKLILLCFKLPVLKRWNEKGSRFANDLLISSREFRNKSMSFWLKLIAATFSSWMARYTVLIFIILLFVPIYDYGLVIAKQLVMWIIMLIAPTPGSSGIAEYVFTVFLEGLIPISIISTLAVIWRLITFYPYLFLGAYVLPSWTKRKFGKT